MSRLKILKDIMNAKGKNIQHPNKANIYIEQNSIHLELNGIVHTVEIIFKGEALLDSNLGLKFRTSYKGNKITIVNIFGYELPEKIFDFVGDINVIDCLILDYNGSFIKADITRNNRETLLESQKTNVEDDTLIIREEPIERLRLNKTGINPIDISKLGKETQDVNQLLTIVPKFSTYKKRIRSRFVETKTTTSVKQMIKKTPTIKGGKY